MTKVKKLSAILAACLMSFSMVGGLSANAAFNAETSNNFQSNEGVTTNMTYLYTTTISSTTKHMPLTVHAIANIQADINL